MMHAGVPNAPFGGVGDSGSGYYHGRHGMDAFTHTRTVVALPTWLDKVMGFRYPPFDIKHKSKIAVKNKLGFKRGEGLQDQKVRKLNSQIPWLKAFSLVCVMVWFVDARLLAGRLQVSPTLNTLGDYLRHIF